MSKITPGGTATLFFPTGAGTGPYGLAFDRDGNLYTANFTSRSVWKFTSGGEPADPPWPVGLGYPPSVGHNPWNLVVDASANVYVANNGAHTVSRITPAGEVTSFNVGNNPRALTVDSAGNVYVANTGSSNISKITASGVVTVAFATGGGLNAPQGITIDRDGNLFVSNFSGATVSKITPVGGDIQPAPPDTPAAPSATAGEESATVTVPANDETDRRYGAPSSYTVSVVGDSSKTCTVTPPATSCEVTGLTAGTAYTFTARANLNTWQTGASNASAPVTPTPTPDPPTPTPDPPTPTPTVIVTGAKAKVTRNSVLLTSKVKVSGKGKIAQQATTGNGKKTKTWCKASKTAAQVGTYALKCNLGKKGRAALRKSALKLTLRTTFTPTTGKAVTANRKLTLKRKR